MNSAAASFTIEGLVKTGGTQVAANDREPSSAVTTTRSGRTRGPEAKGRTPAPSARSTSLRRACLIVYWLGIFFATHWPHVEDFPRPWWMFDHFDLLAHLCAYAGWAAVWAWVLIGEGKWAGGRSARWVAVGGAAYGIMDELTQLIVGREADLVDFLADMAGVILALTVIRWWSGRRSAGRRRMAS